MADAAPRGRGGFGSRGDRGGDRGRGRRGRGRRGGKQEEKEWQPVTKLGRLVKAGKITSMEQIYLHSLPVKEYQIVDFFLPKLKDEVMKVRQTLRTRNTHENHCACEKKIRTPLEYELYRSIVNEEGIGLAQHDMDNSRDHLEKLCANGGNCSPWGERFSG